MPLTLEHVADNPATLTVDLACASGEVFNLRPLELDDAPSLAAFLVGLSPETRQFAPFSGYDLNAARALCDAIARYDKLRLVVETAARIVGLLEFSMDVPTADRERYARHGIALDRDNACRYGPSLTDAYQNRGLGGMLFPHIAEIARRFDQRRIILWGGVHASNARAIRHYEKCGFRTAGAFINSDGLACLDMLIDL